MAQRVYMIPVSDYAASTFCDLLDANADDELEDRFLAIRRSAARHLTTLEVGKLFIRAASDAVPHDRQDVTFNIITACRPYFITSSNYTNAAKRAIELFNHTDRNDLFHKYVNEAKAFTGISPEIWSEIDSAAELDFHEDEWDALLEDIRTARAMRAAFLNDETYGVQVRKKIEIEGIEAYSQDETETIHVGGPELARHYGAIIGPTFGRIAGLCSPTWWLGRNFWLGLFLGANLGKFAWLRRRAELKLQDDLAGCFQMPFSLLQHVAIAGFESAFSPACDAYGTGLYIPPESVSSLLEALERDFRTTVSLACRASGYQRDDAAELTKIVLESLLWAQEHHCGLLEGDELVGSLGYR